MISSKRNLCGNQVLWLAGIAMLVGVAAAPAHGESFKYYVWTDEDNVVHVQGHPPTGHEYETRIIDVDTNVMTGSDIRSSDNNLDASRSGSIPQTAQDEETASSTHRLTDQSTSGIGRTILLEEARREQSGLDTGQTGNLPPDGASPTDGNLPRSIRPGAFR